MNMPKLPASLTVDAVVRAQPSSFLRQKGFVRNGRNFHREQSDLIHSVAFQAFRGAPFSFAVNLSIINDFHSFVVRGTHLPSNPHPGNSAFLSIKRLVFDSPLGPDHWWVIDSPESVPRIASQVAALLGSQLTFFDSWPSIDAIINGFVSGHPDFADRTPLDLAALLSFTGKTDQALALLSSNPNLNIRPGAVARLFSPP